MVKNLEAPDGYWHLRLPHLSSIVQVVDMVTSAIAYSRAHQIPGLLVDATGVSPLIAPTLVDRFLMVETWAFTSKGDVAVAVVAQPAHVDQPLDRDRTPTRVAARVGRAFRCPRR